VHIGCFTVKETLEFAARLRLDESLPYKRRLERASDVMHMLGLEEVADVIVGDALNKASDGYSYV
jgi:ABC-type multidrug transport system ATPase subunit